jgi:hypothetical protein
MRFLATNRIKLGIGLSLAVAITLIAGLEMGSLPAASISPLAPSLAPVSPALSPVSTTPSPAFSAVPTVVPATPTPTPVPTTSHAPTPTPVPTPRPSPSLARSKVIVGTEPMVAVDPISGDVALVSEHIDWSKACDRASVQISSDNGATFSAPSYPWGSYCEDIHTVMAYGVDGRLWVANGLWFSGGYKLSVTHSTGDLAADLAAGKAPTWATPFIEPWTPGWVGCFPMIAVDMDPADYNYGTVYVAYNYSAAAGPGVGLMATNDGSHWGFVKIPVSGLAAGSSPFSRIGYRIVPVAHGFTGLTGGPDPVGIDAYVSYWQDNSILVVPVSFSYGPDPGAAQFGPIGAPVVAVSARGLDPWQSELAFDGTNLWLASSHGPAVLSHQALDSGGALVGGDWATTVLAEGNIVDPVVATEGNLVFFGYRAASDGAAFWRISYDGGATFSAPVSAGVSGNGPNVTNGYGLRDNAIFAQGSFWWALGNGSVYLVRVTP